MSSFFFQVIRPGRGISDSPIWISGRVSESLRDLEVLLDLAGADVEKEEETETRRGFAM